MSCAWLPPQSESEIHQVCAVSQYHKEIIAGPPALPYRGPAHKLARRPLRVPLSRENGATPAKAAISLRVNVPSSGRFARSVVVSRRPTPGTLRNTSSFSRHTGLCRMVVGRSVVLCSSSFSSRAIWACTRCWTGPAARRAILVRRRHLDQRSPTCKACVCSSGIGRIGDEWLRRSGRGCAH